jgi:HPt (histidine-containing phosphotransfer) domain-containing protein
MPDLVNQNASFSLDLTYLLEVGNNNLAFVEKMLLHFKSDIPNLLEGLKSSIETNDAAEVKLLAHKAKSVAGYFSDLFLHSLMQEIEEDGAKDRIGKSTNLKFEIASLHFLKLCAEIEAYLEITDSG